MKTITSVLSKVLVREFYREHAGFFLVVVGIAAGFMRAPEHMALAGFFTSQPLTALIPIGLWLLYTLRIISFNAQALKRSENSFVYNLVFLPAHVRLYSLIQVLYVQLLPALAYGAFLVVIALRNGMWPAVVLLTLSLAGFIPLAVYGLEHVLHHPGQEHRVSALQRYINRTFTRPSFLFFMGWIVRRQVVMLIWSKVFSCALLFAMLKLYTTDDYDIRLMGLGTVLAFAATVNVVWELHRFNNFHFALLRQLPFSLARHMAGFMLTLLILTLPETGLLVSRFPRGFGVTAFLSNYCFALSIPFLFYSLLYIKDRHQEQLMTPVFCLVIGWFVLVLFSVPLAVLAGLNAAIGITVWKIYWYKFEYLADSTPD